MSDIPFDTLAVTRQLEAKGFNTGQVEAITEAVRAGVTGGVATKADLTELKTEIRGDMGEIRGEMGELRTELKWIKLIGAAILAVLVLPWLAEPISATLPSP